MIKEQVAEYVITLYIISREQFQNLIHFSEFICLWSWTESNSALLHQLFDMFQFVTLLQDNEVTYPNISDKSKYVLGHCQNQLKSVRTAGDRKDYAFSKCLSMLKKCFVWLHWGWFVWHMSCKSLTSLKHWNQHHNY